LSFCACSGGGMHTARELRMQVCKQCVGSQADTRSARSPCCPVPPSIEPPPAVGTGLLPRLALLRPPHGSGEGLPGCGR
jgi:hypothetical protein